MTSPISHVNAGFSPLPPLGASGATGGSGSFAGLLDAAKSAVGSVSQMQNDATAAVEQLALGETDDMVGVMSAVEKGELAFKMLLAVRSKLMTAFDEIRNMPI